MTFGLQGVLPQTMKLPSGSIVEKEMARPSKWADVFHIIYTIHLLGINLIVFDFESGVIYCGTHSRPGPRPALPSSWRGSDGHTSSPYLKCATTERRTGRSRTTTTF